MTNPYPHYIQDETCPGVEVENPLYVAWEKGWSKGWDDGFNRGYKVGYDTGYEAARREFEKDRRSWENEGSYARAHGDY